MFMCFSVEIQWKWQPIPVFLPGKFHGQRNLVVYTQCGCQQSDVTEHSQACTHTHTHTHTHAHTHSLQYIAHAAHLWKRFGAILWKTVRGAWYAAIHGVAKSRTQLSDFTFTFHFRALEKEMATHSSVLAWRIPGTGKPGGLPSMGSHRVGHDWSDLAAAAVVRRKHIL